MAKKKFSRKLILAIVLNKLPIVQERSKFKSYVHGITQKCIPNSSLDTIIRDDRSLLLTQHVLVGYLKAQEAPPYILLFKDSSSSDESTMIQKYEEFNLIKSMIENSLEKPNLLVLDNGLDYEKKMKDFLK